MIDTALQKSMQEMKPILTKIGVMCSDMGVPSSHKRTQTVAPAEGG